MSNNKKYSNGSEIMSCNQAIERILWRFENFDVIRVNERDIKALNRIVDFINEKQHRDLSENKYLFNLYLNGLSCLLERFNTTIENTIPHKELNRIISRPSSNIIEEIALNSNFRHKEQFLIEVGINLNKHPSLKSAAEKDMEIKKLSSQISVKNNRDRLLRDIWTLEEIEISLKNQFQNLLYGL
jgi:hypothetical protein